MGGINIKSKPNILFFFTDQQRFDTVGCYGQKLNITPHLDRMASEGVRFDKAFTPQPVCGPARSCIQTGKYATQTGCFRNDIALPLNEKTIAHYIREAGYDTGYIGKWHLASTLLKDDYKKKPVPTERRGGWLDYWMAADVLEFTSTGSSGYLFDKDMSKVEFEKYRADALTDFALDYLENKRNREKPFFLFISYLEPHHQNTTHRYEGPPGSRDKYKNYEPPEDLKGTEGDWRDSYPDYLGCCNNLDMNLGRILDKLSELGIREETLVIYASDHGTHFKTRNSEYKRSCHDSSIRIPLIINGPGFKGGQSVNELVSLMDLPPTFLKAAQLGKPAYMPGRPLQDLMEGGTEDWPKEVFVQISESQVGRAIRTDAWKYSVKAVDKHGWLHKHSDVYIEEFLYDLENDPYEKTNLVHSPAHVGIRKSLSEMLKKRLIEAGEPETRILPCTPSNISVYLRKKPLKILEWLIRRQKSGRQDT